MLAADRAAVADDAERPLEPGRFVMSIPPTLRRVLGRWLSDREMT
jgi:hypothetical protein